MRFVPSITQSIFMLNLNFRSSATSFIQWGLSLLLLVAAGIHGRADDFGDISVTFTGLSSGETRHGYRPFNVRITNRSTSASHLVEIVIPNRSYSQSGNVLTELSRSVEVSPNSTVGLDLFQPAVPIYANDQASVRVDGRNVGETHSWSSFRNHAAQMGYGGGSAGVSGKGPFSILVSSSRSFNQSETQDGLLEAASPYLTTSARAIPGGGVGKLIDWHLSQISISQWPMNWLSYTAYDGIFLDEQEFQSAPPLVQSAIERYVTAGGFLALMNSKISGPPFDVDKIDKKSANYIQSHKGFGEVQLFRMEGASWFEGSDYSELLSGLHATELPWKNIPDSNDANSVFPIVDELRVPIRGFTALMLIFIILIGPVNFFILSKMNKRIWVIWTTPLIAGLTCVILFVYSLISEGVNSKELSRSMVFLDQSNNQFAYLGTLAYYCPLTPSEGLQFDNSTEVSPWISMNRWVSGTARSMNWDDGQRLTRGWIAARTPAHFYVRKAGTRRERLEISRDAQGNLIALNGLGSSIEELIYRNEQGERFELTGLEAGQSGLLRPMTGISESEKLVEPASMRDFYSNSVWTDIETNLDLEKIGPQMYMAVLDGDPFLGDPLNGRVNSDRKTVVLGKLEKTANPE